MPEREAMNSTDAQTGIGSGEWLDINQPDGSGNEPRQSYPLQTEQKDGHDCRCRTSNLSPDVLDLEIPLPQLLGMAECREAAGMLFDDLAGTDPQRQHLEALLSLWQSLGRPETGFWKETTVRVNRVILEAYSSNIIISVNPRVKHKPPLPRFSPGIWLPIQRNGKLFLRRIRKGSPSGKSGSLSFAGLHRTGVKTN